MFPSFYLQTKKIYLILAIVIAICLGLQFLWIKTLYQSEKNQLEKQIDRIINEASTLSIYEYVGGENRLSTKEFKEFFLSPQFTQFRNAFDNSKMKGLKSFFEYDIYNDSIQLRVQFDLKREDTKPVSSSAKTKIAPFLQSHEDSLSLQFMDSIVRNRLHLLGGIGKSFYILSTYGRDRVLPGNYSKEELVNADFKSSAYSYNLNHIAKYQLVIPSLSGAVYYHLRYFLLSSFLLLLVIIFAMYFLFRFLLFQKMFAEARVGFISNMTHEFKTPLATVKLALESIIKYELQKRPEKLYEYVQMSQIELERLDLLVDNILSLKSDKESGLRLQMQAIDMQQIIHQVIESMSLICEKKKAIIKFHPCPEYRIVFGDKAHLGNVFYNLIDNALKYTVRTPEIEINCSADADHIYMYIKDNGMGIAPVYHKKIFERFFRVPDFARKAIKGTGLGLHYVKEIIVQHNGKVKIESMPDEGSLFIIQLPKYEKE